MGLDALYTYCETREDRKAVDDWLDGKRPDFPLMEREWEWLRRNAQKLKESKVYIPYIFPEDEFEQ